ncbi:uncharacterized protein LOC110059540 isoform X1 [Orbicella faveolata]|uniref:uncharacterized protein LOC110059540 isoform X1 n=1 Tax=Orbicella faveolata TaxID=48498 RepID=UPI0009E19FF1|nr:uncharacterized protein LOC110059540 isoform X1 [Orbicella faveolata]
MSDYRAKKRPWSDERERGHWKRPRSDEHERRQEEKKPFDLMPPNEKCDTFKVAFDYYTPRAHFIILPRDKSKPGTDYNSLEPGARLKVVKTAMAMVSHYHLENHAILSLHFGSWITTKNMFHAHVCSDVNEYLSVYESKKREIPNWPSREYVTKQWKASKDPRNYAINVQQYPLRTYFKEEVEAVTEYRRSKPNTAEATFTPSPPFTAILYHPSEPRVGFAVEKSAKPKSAESFLEAQEAIVKFASQNKLTDMSVKGDDNGCHVCLVLDEKSHGFILEDSQFLVGYIQITGLKFYRDLCPHDKRDDWFDKFSSMEDYKVYT